MCTALCVDHQDANAHNSLGSMYLQRGDLAQVAEEFSAAIRLKPTFASARYNLGLVVQREIQAGEAAAEFKRTLAADP